MTSIKYAQQFKMNMLKGLKKIIDSVQSRVEEVEKRNIGFLAQILGLRDRKHITKAEINKFLYREIATNLQCTNSECYQREFLGKCIKQLVLELIMFDETPDPYYTVLKIIGDATRELMGFVSIKQIRNWRKAIIAAKDYDLMNPFQYPSDIESLGKFENRTYNVGKSARNLRDSGYEISIKNNDLYIDESILQNIAKSIEDDIKLLGGQYVAAQIFRMLENSYDFELERYFIVRNTRFVPVVKSPQVPFNFILNLCVKHPFKHDNDNKTRDEIFKRILGKSAFLINTYDVELDNFAEMISHGSEDFIDFIREIALYDSCFPFIQLKSTTAIDIVEGLLRWSDSYWKAIIGFSFYDIINIMREILSISRGCRGPFLIDVDKFAEKLSMGINDVIQILSVFTHTGRQVNRGFLLPTDYDKVDFPFYPLIKINDSTYLLFDRSWCAPAFYEALVSKLRYFGIDNLESRIGVAIEEFLRTHFTKHGIKHKTGQYNIDGTQGECDIIIEADKGICFIESKKKVLTRKSKGGSDVDLVIDLCKSFLAAQLQAGQHEIVLKKHGEIQITKSQGQSTKLTHNSRQIERIALTHLDFGGFQDRIVLEQLFRILLMSKVETRSKDQGIIDNIKSIKLQLTTLKEQYDKINEIDSITNRRPFFNCWFLSVPQLMLLIEDSNSNNDFWDRLYSVRNISTCSMDFYFEWASIKKIRR